MSIDYYGYLGEDIKKYKEEYFKNYKEIFILYEEINHFLQKIKFKLQVKDNKIQDIYSTFIYKIIGNFSSYIRFVKKLHF